MTPKADHAIPFFEVLSSVNVTTAIGVVSSTSLALFAGEGFEPKCRRVEERERAQKEGLRKQAQQQSCKRAREAERERWLTEVRANNNMMHVL
jgi:hypothetical protein